LGAVNLRTTTAIATAQDAPEGHDDCLVNMIKAGGAMCKACYYLKRGSLNNMKVSDLVAHITENESFADK